MPQLWLFHEERVKTLMNGGVGAAKKALRVSAKPPENRQRRITLGGDDGDSSQVPDVARFN